MENHMGKNKKINK